MVVATANLLYIPMDNAPMPKRISNPSTKFSETARQLNVPSLIIGIGLQAEIRDDQDLETTIQSLHLHQGLRLQALVCAETSHHAFARKLASMRAFHWAAPASQLTGQAIWVPSCIISGKELYKKLMLPNLPSK